MGKGSRYLKTKGRDAKDEAVREGLLGDDREGGGITIEEGKQLLREWNGRVKRGEEQLGREERKGETKPGNKIVMMKNITFIHFFE